MSSIVRGLLQSANTVKNVQLHLPNSFFITPITMTEWHLRGQRTLNVTVEDEKNTSVTASVDQFHLLLQVLQSNSKPLMNGKFHGICCSRGGAQIYRIQPHWSRGKEWLRCHCAIWLWCVSGEKLQDSSMELTIGLAKWWVSVALLFTRESIEGIVDDQDEEGEKSSGRLGTGPEKGSGRAGAHQSRTSSPCCSFWKGFWLSFGHEVQKVEELQKNAMAATLLHIWWELPTPPYPWLDHKPPLR